MLSFRLISQSVYVHASDGRDWYWMNGITVEKATGNYPAMFKKVKKKSVPCRLLLALSRPRRGTMFSTFCRTNAETNLTEDLGGGCPGLFQKRQSLTRMPRNSAHLWLWGLVWQFQYNPYTSSTWAWVWASHGYIIMSGVVLFTLFHKGSVSLSTVQRCFVDWASWLDKG